MRFCGGPVSLKPLPLFPLLILFYFLNVLLFIFLKMFFTFRERGRKGEGEKHQCMVASHSPLLGTWPPTQASALPGD